MSHSSEPRTYQQIQATDEFQALRRSLRRFAFPATALFLAWYLLYVLMSAYARDVMDTKLLGNINVAYVLGLLQFVSTFVIAYVYSRYADKHVDPVADRLRAEIEGEGR
ncbi:MAG: rane protein-like protein [Frankiales bacterium]|nr:rane protein-like protein [Frankiales bacterium]